MRALIDWSYDLAQRNRAYAFPAHLGISSAAGRSKPRFQCAATKLSPTWDIVEILGSLVEKSLVVVDLSRDDQRYRMLESTRQYARDRLVQSTEDQRFARKHAEHMERTMATFYERYWSSPALPAVRSVAPEIDNLRAALTWSLIEGMDPELGCRVAALSANLFVELGVFVEGFRWLSLAGSAYSGGDALWSGRLAYGTLLMVDAGSVTISLQYAERAVRCFRECGTPELSSALSSYTMALWRKGRNEEALVAAAESVAVARAGSDRVRLALALRAHAITATLDPSIDEATVRGRFEEALRIARTMGDDSRIVAVLSWFAEWELRIDPAHCAALGREALAIVGRTDDPRKVFLSYNLSAYLLEIGEIDEAVAYAREALRGARVENIRSSIAYSIQRLALVTALRERFEEAARLFGYVEAQFVSQDLSSDFAEDRMRTRTAETLGAGLPEDVLVRLMAEGAEMGDEDAIGAALAATAEPDLVGS